MLIHLRIYSMAVQSIRVIGMLASYSVVIAREVDVMFPGSKISQGAAATTIFLLTGRYGSYTPNP
jgi:hypothetical protein